MILNCREFFTNQPIHLRSQFFIPILLPFIFIIKNFVADFDYQREEIEKNLFQTVDDDYLFKRVLDEAYWTLMGLAFSIQVSSKLITFNFIEMPGIRRREASSNFTWIS